MKIVIQCPSCLAKYKVVQATVGKTVSCAKCKNPFHARKATEQLPIHTTEESVKKRDINIRKTSKDVEEKNHATKPNATPTNSVDTSLDTNSLYYSTDRLGRTGTHTGGLPRYEALTVFSGIVSAFGWILLLIGFIGFLIAVVIFFGDMPDAGTTRYSERTTDEVMKGIYISRIFLFGGVILAGLTQLAFAELLRAIRDMAINSYLNLDRKAD